MSDQAMTALMTVGFIFLIKNGVPLGLGVIGGIALWSIKLVKYCKSKRKTSK